MPLCFRKIFQRCHSVAEKYNRDGEIRYAVNFDPLLIEDIIRGTNHCAICYDIDKQKCREKCYQDASRFVCLVHNTLRG